MKTLKISEEAHTNLIRLQLKLYEITHKKYTFSQIIEKYYIEDLSDQDDQTNDR